MAGAHPGVHRGPAQQGCLYSLFAVVVHKGDIQGGHYITYVRCGGSWFCCDDAWITLVEESEVAAAQAYMLFLTSNDYYQEAPLGLGA
jgi:ubiquitin carboxyl-terminal hydrolase 22/27/51